MATIQTLVDNNEETIYNYIDSNPGETEAEIVTGTGVGAVIVNNLLRILGNQGILRRAMGVSGAAKWYTTADWSQALVSNLASARTWIASNDGGLVSEMATALTIADEIAMALAHMMEHERRIATSASE